MLFLEKKRSACLPSSLAERESLLQHAEDRLGHRLGPPGLEWSTLAKAQIVHEALIGVPALLPHGLQLILVAVCWNSPPEKPGKKH